MAGVQPPLVEELKKAQVLDQIGAENVFEAQTGLGASEDAALEAAEKWLATHQDKEAASDSDTGDDE